MSVPQRVAVKIPTRDPSAPVDLPPFIGIFHRFIQQQKLPGLLVDVADYSHVPDGPGVVLIGHDVDYGIDLVGGAAGLLTLRKRYEGVSFAEILRDTLGKAFTAVAALEQEPASALGFDTGALTVELFDRLTAKNTDEAFETWRKEAEPVADALYGSGSYELSRVHADDPRKALALRLAGEPADAATLIARLAA